MAVCLKLSCCDRAGEEGQDRREGRSAPTASVTVWEGIQFCKFSSAFLLRSLISATSETMFASLPQTDTASVLQEASGYIKFLHQQLEVLISVTAQGTMIFSLLFLHFC